MEKKEMTFGELKAGDIFLYNGKVYEKISGNMADVIDNDKVIRTVEFSADTIVTMLS